MQLIIPSAFNVWIGGYVGPSYKAYLEDQRVVYEVYEYGYTLHNRETLEPTARQWSRFLRKLDDIDVWSWQADYGAPDRAATGTETDEEPETTWSLEISHNGRQIVSRGNIDYAPGFVAFLRAVRDLLGNRQFA